MNIEISSGKVQSKQKIVIYGPEGVGKSTLASCFPKPLFIDTEGSTNRLNVNRFKDKPKSWDMLKNYIEFVKQHPDCCETLVIDTIDWAERLCIEGILAAHDKKGIEDFGYGNGYTYVAEEIGRFLNTLQELIDKDICNVILTAHAQLKKFEQPNEAGAYDRYELKLGKKTTSQTAPLVKEWADTILFCNYETFAVATDKDGKKFKGQGGRRVMFTSHHPCWDAKNRDGLPEKLPMDYAQIAHIVGDCTPVPQTSPASIPVVTSAQAVPAPAPAPAPAQTATDLSDFEEIKSEPNIPADIPPALQDLMRVNEVSEEEIRFAVASRGYYPEALAISKYDPTFINGVLIAAWGQVFEMIKDNRKLPF